MGYAGRCVTLLLCLVYLPSLPARYLRQPRWDGGGSFAPWDEMCTGRCPITSPVCPPSVPWLPCFSDVLGHFSFFLFIPFVCKISSHQPNQAEIKKSKKKKKKSKFYELTFQTHRAPNHGFRFLVEPNNPRSGSPERNARDKITQGNHTGDIPPGCRTLRLLTPGTGQMSCPNRGGAGPGRYST